MGAVLGLTRALGQVNAAVLTLGRGLGALCMALMVVIILVQVFWRYVLNNALPWPEEAARFLMIWATGLMAATAFRRGGFVSIELFVRLLPVRAASVLSLILLGLCLVVLWVGIGISWSEVTGIGGRFEMDALRYPATLDLSVWTKVPRAAQMAGMLVGLILLIAVCVELMLRNLVSLMGGHDRLPEIADAVSLGAE
ncbi:TRAP transporter small permease [Pseudotabrizicola sp. L79]|uniref:TRAP transporter small permease n=1 Tax=Pseudotabrizicola sp. L79 TaxID=3118402 RepID=UPI002F91E053